MQTYLLHIQYNLLTNLCIFFSVDALSFEKVIKKEVDLTDILGLVTIINNIANNTLYNSNVKNLMFNTNEHFDVVIAEWLYTEIYGGYVGT